jgi:hypothetical protein
VTILNFDVKFFGYCSIAFGIQSNFVALSWHTHRVLYHSKWTKNGKDIGFEIREGLELFLEKNCNKISQSSSYFTSIFFPCSFVFNALTTFVVF